MADEAIKQHKRMAMGEDIGTESIANPFRQVGGDKGTRGELKDSARNATIGRESAYDNDGDKDY